MAFEPKKLVSNYFKKKKPLSIFFDAVFVILILLLLIPATRKETAAFFIRWTSLPAGQLDEEEAYNIGADTRLWKIYDSQGNYHEFSELNDKPVFLNFWATWCPPCVGEMPSIQELYDTYGDEVNFVLVTNEIPEVVTNFMEQNDYQNLPVYFAMQAPPAFASQALPTTFIIGKDGKVWVKKKGAARWNSGKTKSLLEQLINQ